MLSWRENYIRNRNIPIQFYKVSVNFSCWKIEKGLSFCRRILLKHRREKIAKVLHGVLGCDVAKDLGKNPGDREVDLSDKLLLGGWGECDLEV